MAGDAHGLGRGMALGAVVGPDKTRTVGGGLVEGIEHGADAGIDGGEFEEIRAGDIADISGIVEVEGAWVVGTDAVALERGLGEDEHLGRGGDAEFAEDGGEIAEPAILGEGDFAAIDAFLQTGNRAGVRGLGVAEEILVIGQQVGAALEIAPERQGEHHEQQRPEGKWGERERSHGNDLDHAG